MPFWRRNQVKNLTNQLYHSDVKPENGSTWYSDLRKSTIAGVIVGLPLAYIFQYSGVPQDFAGEAIVRSATGGSDGLFEGGRSLFRRYIRKIKDGGSTTWYAYGKMAGVGVASLSDYLWRNLTDIDIHSKATSFIPALYSQGDQLIAYLALMGYYLMHTNGNVVQRLGNFSKDLVALSSLGVYGVSVGIYWGIRHFHEPNSFLDHSIETLILTPLCIIPPMVGSIIEKKKAKL